MDGLIGPVLAVPLVHQRVRVRHDPEHPPEYSVAEVSLGGLLLGLVPVFIGVVFTAAGSVVDFALGTFGL